MSRSLQERIRMLGKTASTLADQTVEHIEGLEADQRALREQLQVGGGHLVEALLRANKTAFAAEVERVDFELLDRLLPVVWPECLVKLGSIKPTDAEALCCFIDGDGLDDAEGIAQDIATLERLKRLIDETLSLLATRLKARSSKDGIA